MLRRSLYKFSDQISYRGNFIFKSIQKIEDFNVELVEYEHQPTKAKFYQIKTEDANNVFAASFRSRVQNSKGTPHILEHLVCCGSEKYPIRDPFMAMSKKSSNTFMNAWTGPDFIGFPFASTNEKDFLNLLDVYLDLIYKPLLQELDFRQEGWRLEFAEEGVDIKGVVFNEMKGYYQSAESIFHQYILKKALRGTEYEHIYGGDPLQIPTLQHQELIDFYNRTMNPSESVFYFYGNHLINPIMEKIEKYLKVNEAKKFTFPNQTLKFDFLSEILPLPPSLEGSSEKQGYLSLTYKLQKSLIDDPILNLAFSIIQSVLFEQQSGLLFKRVIDVGLAEGFGKMGGTEFYGEFSLFNFAFQGVQKEKKTVDQIIKIIDDTLTELAYNGFPQDLVDGAIHQSELYSKMPSGEQGMKILELTLGNMIHQKNIASVINFTKNIDELKKKISQGYLQEVVKEHLLLNETKTVVYAQPDEKFLENIIKQEQKLIENICDNLTEDQVYDIAIKNSLLEKHQNEEQDFSVLPSLNLTDIEIEKKPIKTEQTLYTDVPIHFVQEQTNGITFLKIKLDVGPVTMGMRQYLEIFCHFIKKVGTEKLKHDTVAKLLNLSSSGFEAKMDSHCDVNDANQTNTFITFSISCLDSKLNQMIDIFSEILTEPYFKDRDNIQSILRNTGVQLQSDLLDESLTYAQFLANSSLRQSQFIKDVNFSTRFLLNLTTKYTQSPSETQGFYVDDLNFQMTSLMNYLMKAGRMQFMVHTGQKENTETGIKRIIDDLKKRYEGFNNQINLNEPLTFKPDYGKKIITLPSQVNFVVQGVQMPHFSHLDTPKLLVLGQFLSNSLLHSQIREKGGAYGAGCSVSPLRGVINLWSYRDPNINETLNIFNQASQQNQITNEELKDAKFSVFQRLDRPIDPQQKGVEEIFYGLTTDLQNQLRQRIINTTKDDLIQACEQYLKNPIVQQQYSIGVFASANHTDVGILKDSGIIQFLNNNQGFNVRDFLQTK